MNQGFPRILCLCRKITGNKALSTEASRQIPTGVIPGEHRYLIGTRSSIATRIPLPRPTSASPTHWKIGDLVSYQEGLRQFQVENVLLGGMGVVYVVTDTRSGDPFVVKGIREQFAFHPGLRARFRREAEAWMALQKHSNIVQARGFEVLDNRPHIFLEYVSGGSLRGMLNHAEQSVSDILHLAVQICRGMRYAYSMGLVAHRDLKPDNILLTTENTAKVTDFGLVKLWEDGRSLGSFTALEPDQPGAEPLTRLDAPGFGTKEYMPPEQWRSAGNADVRSDIYSFGVMLYEMLAGIRPFYGKTREEIRDSHFRSTPAPVSSLRPDVPPSVEALIGRCLQKNPDDRFSSFTTLHHELTRILHQEFRQVIPLPSREQLTISELNERGAAFFNLGKYNQALACFNQVVKSDPGHETAWANRGVTLAELGFYNEALVSFDRALAIRPESARILTNKGLTLFELGRYQESAVCYDRAVKIDPLLEEVWRYRAEVLNELGQYEQAYYAALKARQLDPEDERSYYHEALALIRLGRLDIASDAIVHYENRAGVLTSGGRWLRALLAHRQGQYQRALLLCAAIQPGSPEYWQALLLGMECALTLGDLDEAEVLLEHLPTDWMQEEILHLMISALQYSGSPPARLLVMASETAVRARDFVTAQSCYESWLEQRHTADQQPEIRTPELDMTILCGAIHPDAHQAIAQGSLLLRLEELRAAVRCLWKGLEELRDEVHGWRDLGEALNRLGEFSKAMIAFGEVVRLAPSDGAAWLAYAEAAVRTRQYRIGLTALEEAHNLGSDNTVYLFLQAVALLGIGQYQAALRLFDRTLNMEATFALAWWNKHLCLWRLGRSRDANRCLHRARSLDPRLWRQPPYQPHPIMLYPLILPGLPARP